MLLLVPMRGKVVNIMFIKQTGEICVKYSASSCSEKFYNNNKQPHNAE